MNFVEKVFKQHPFIYCIGGKYYAFGTGVCSECDMKSVLLESRYRKFVDSIDIDLKDCEAWEIFRKVSFEAKCVMDDGNVCTNPEAEIVKFGFSENEMNELKKQVDRYVDYFTKHRLYIYSRK